MCVIKSAEESGNYAAGTEFGVSKAHVRYWQKQKTTLLSDKRVLRGPNEGKYPDLENELVRYIHESGSNCCGVTHKMLMCNVLEIPRNLHISLPYFKAGREWLTRFMKHNNRLRRSTSLCQRLQMDYSRILISFQHYTTKIPQYKFYDL